MHARFTVCRLSAADNKKHLAVLFVILATSVYLHSILPIKDGAQEGTRTPTMLLAST